MAYKSYSVQNIEKKYRDAARKTLKTIIAEEVKTALKNNIINTVYDTPEGEYYERTFAMLMSIISETVIDNDYETLIQIYADPDRMTYDYHSWKTGDDKRDLIVKWLDKGTSGSPIYNHEANEFIEKTVEEINGIINEALRQAFNRVSSK